MLNALRRWYRWVFNPTPIVGQYWILDGIGRVRVTEIRSIYVYWIATDGTKADCRMGTFQSMGVLWQPRTLTEAAEHDSEAQHTDNVLPLHKDDQ